MAVGSFDVTNPGLNISQASLQTLVCRYDVNLSPRKRYTVIPRVVCTRIEQREGHQPSTAQFIYIQANYDPEQPASVPTQFQHYWANASTINQDYIVQTGDRIVVLAVTGKQAKVDPVSGEVTFNGTTRVMFDGFARVPQINIEDERQAVTFMAAGVEVRCWDVPLHGILMIDSTNTNGDVSGPVAQVLPVALPWRFNPEGNNNCTPSTGDYDPTNAATVDQYGEQKFPVFVDWRLKYDPGAPTTSLLAIEWTIDKAAKAILGFANGAEDFIANPTFSVLDELLRNRVPVNGNYYDPKDSTTFTESPIALRDMDVTNMAWPDAIDRILGYGGFGMRFVCEDDENGEPSHYVEIYRKDNSGPNAPKQIQYPASGSFTSDYPQEIQALHLTHDYHGVANQIVIETKPIRYELSFVLAPGFTPQNGDQLAANRSQFLRGNLTGLSSVYYKYRLWVIDEDGTGHFDMVSKTWVTTPFDFSPIFPNDVFGDRTYIQRRRPGSRHVFSLGSDLKPLRSSLAVSRDYAGKTPDLWDGTGNWQTITGGFELLDDRCGIWVSENDPGHWNIGQMTQPSPQEMSTVLDAITGMANLMGTGGTTQRTKPFFLRLTTTIEGDYDIRVTAERRDASPVPYAVERAVDCRDHFTVKPVLSNSCYGGGTSAAVESELPNKLGPFGVKYIRDDTPAAEDHATQLQRVHEFPPISGAVVIPYITFNWSIGDRISKINGRDLSFQINSGGNQGEAPTYPYVVGITWTLNPDRQTTHLQISDKRAEPQRVTGSNRARANLNAVRG